MTETTWNRRTCIEAESPGVMFSEQYYYDVERRSIPAALAVLPDSPGIFRFRFFDALSAEVKVEGEMVPVKKSENYSPWHYLGGTIHTLAEVEAMGDDHRRLISNMKANGWDKAIHTPLGNWHPWTDDNIYVAIMTDPVSVLQAKKLDDMRLGRTEQRDISEKDWARATGYSSQKS